MLKSIAFAALLSLPIAVFAQSQAAKTVTKENSVTATATITAIDPATRSITLRTEKGDEDTFTVGPDVTRFNQLKVGDNIRVTDTKPSCFSCASRAPQAALPVPQSPPVASRRYLAAPSARNRR